jgi:hypothetical protein
MNQAVEFIHEVRVYSQLNNQKCIELSYIRGVLSFHPDFEEA